VINEETIQKLVDMKLHAMAAMLREMTTSPPTDDLSIEERIGMLVDREWGARENKRLERLLKDARVPAGVCVEDLACDPARGVDKSYARSLASCQWVRGKQNVIVLGATGVGKTFLGGALAQAACRQGFRALCIRTPRLLHRLAVARAGGTYSQELARIAKLIATNPKLQIRFVAHELTHPSAQENLAVAQKKIATLRDALLRRGVAPRDRFVAVGQEPPLRAGTTPLIRAWYSRVELENRR